MYSRSSFQIPHDCIHFIEAQLIRTGLVLWSPKGGIPVYTEFPCLKIFPLHNFQKRDCLRIIAHTFGIGLLLLMSCTTLLIMDCLVYIAAAAALALASKLSLQVGNVFFCLSDEPGP